MSLKNSRRPALLAVSMLSLAAPAYAAPSVEDALKLAPVQQGIQYDSPTADEAKACKITPEKIGGATAWVVRGADGAILRQFSDSNNDNVVDTVKWPNNYNTGASGLPTETGGRARVPCDTAPTPGPAVRTSEAWDRPRLPRPPRRPPTW